MWKSSRHFKSVKWQTQSDDTDAEQPWHFWGGWLLCHSQLPAHISWKRLLMDCTVSQIKGQEVVERWSHCFASVPRAVICELIWCCLPRSQVLLSPHEGLLIGQWDGDTMQLRVTWSHMKRQKTVLTLILLSLFCMCTHIQARLYSIAHTLEQKQMQNKLRTPCVTLAICNLSCSLGKIIEATSQYANGMIIVLTTTPPNTCTERERKNCYIVSNI